MKDSQQRTSCPAAVCLALAISGISLSAAASPPANIARKDSRFLDDLQRRTFDFFWETADPVHGLTPDRWPSKSPSSIAAIGFGLTAYGVGVERNWLEREDAAQRVLATLRFFRDSPQSDQPTSAAGFRGFYYHFLDMDTGHRFRRCELSSIDTALLMAGVLFCGEYFDLDNPTENEIRDLADTLYRRVEWDWMQPREPLIAMAWRPEARDYGKADYHGYNEAMLLYVLALGSPTHAIDPAAWTAFTHTYDWASFQGQSHVNFPPLFGHQYSHVWIDFRKIQDAYVREKGIDYFENSRRATLSQRAYAIANPLGWQDYGADIWGLTACDGPANKQMTYRGELRRFHTYTARGASSQRIEDDGTIAPTAAGGSIPFAPEIALPALRAMQQRYGVRLYGRYGFLDSFNPSFKFPAVDVNGGVLYDDIGWINGDYLGIDQGPILLMAENYRSELIWRVMKRSKHLRAGLQRAGFTGGWIDNQDAKGRPVQKQRQLETPTDEAQNDIQARAGMRITGSEADTKD